MADDSPQLLPGTLYMLILRSLSAGPLHGYAIARRIKQCSAEVLDVEEGSLYPALNRMLLKGWLRAEWGIRKRTEKQGSTGSQKRVGTSWSPKKTNSTNWLGPFRW